MFIQGKYITLETVAFESLYGGCLRHLFWHRKSLELKIEALLHETEGETRNRWLLSGATSVAKCCGSWVEVVSRDCNLGPIKKDILQNQKQLCETAD